MANEFKHKDPGSTLTSAEFIASDGTGHIVESQATGDILYASSATVLKALPKGSNGDVLSLAAGIPDWTTSAASATVASTVVVIDGTDTSSFVALFDSATGSLAIKTDASITYNAGTGTLTVTGIELGHASDTTITRGAAGLLEVEGVRLVTVSATQTLTNKTLTTPTIGSFANSAHDHADAAGGAAVVSAGAAVSGIVELATIAEANTGTDAARAVTPDGLAGSVHGEKVIQMVVVDFTAALTTGNGKFYFHVPSTLNGFDIVDVHAEVITAPVGSTIIIQLRNVTQSDVDILSTLLTIDAGETGSDTAAAAAALNTGASRDALATNDVIAVDIDQIGSSTAGSGLIVTLICRLP
jgi:hypothetical protein